MELKDYLEMGARKAGSLTALGNILGMSQPRMSRSKAQKEPIPIDAVVKLSDYIGEDLKAIIAANELVTEKKDEKREFWRPFVEHARAASIAFILTIALVANFMSPTPAEAAPLLDSGMGILCIMLSAVLKQCQLNRFLEMIVKPFQTVFPTRRTEPQAI
jgi:predicted transcriptional regulator